MATTEAEAEIVNLAELAATHSRMVELSILSRQPDRAYAAIDRAFDLMAESYRPPPDSPLEAILSLRIAAILASAGLTTIADLQKETRDSLVRINQIRYRSVDLIERELHRHGYQLGESIE